MAKRTTPTAISTSSKCPNCGDQRLVPIVYGFPGESLMGLAEQGMVELGGCLVGPDDPLLVCSACHHSVWPDGRTRDTSTDT